MKFEALYDQYKNMVFNLALHYVQSKEDAEEITQDVFVAVFQSLESFRQGAAVSTWLYRITINRSLDFIKAKKRKKRYAFISSLFKEQSNELRFEPEEPNHPGVQLEEKEAMNALFAALNLLPEKQKTAIILHKIEQMPQAEVAQVMQLSVKAVESLIQRAKANILKRK